ncbi:MAG: FKBP-type peptidyl-prolyl cis-trans isomerase [Paludibacteraceae bacterium]|nr:FKBP-type peptidyl-prolyl cis-trans isomerase [Paludibacteraceae bacterium]
MRKIMLLSAVTATMMAVVATSCNFSGKVKLETPADSLSYAAGVVQSNGLVPFLQDAFKVDSAQINDIIDGIDDVVTNTSDKKHAYMVGLGIGVQLKEQVLPSINFRMFREDSLHSINADTFIETFVASAKGENMPMNASEAQLYITTQSRAIHLDSIAITPEMCDTLSMAFGVAQSEGFATYLTQAKGVDSTYVDKVFEGVLDAAKATESKKAYNVGVNIGEQILDQIIPYMNKELFMDEETFKQDVFFAAFFASMRGDDLLMDEMEAGAYVREESQKRFESKMEAEYGDNKAAGIAFLENNKTQEGVQVTASGLQYKVLKQGKGANPVATSTVKVHYHGTLIDGTVFDSSVERGTPAEFALNQVIAGWTEGVQLMNKGAKYQFFIPYELAYGTRPMGEIKPFSTLIFEVELLDIVK